MYYDKFLQLCEEREISKQKACQKAGLSSNAWIRWSTGSLPGSASLQKICKFFNVTPESMIDDTREIEKVESPVSARQKLFDNTEMRVLFDAAQNVPAYKLYEVASQLMKWKEDNGVN